MVNKNELSAARMKAGLTQEEVAKQLGISPNTYGKKEAGHSDFKLTEVLRLCKILEISASDRDKIFLSA